MSDAETIVDTFSDSEIVSDPETLSDGTTCDDERPSRRRRALCVSFLYCLHVIRHSRKSAFLLLTYSRSQKPKANNKSKHRGCFTRGVKAAIPMSAAAIEHCK
jgi:hypothetical protein